MTPDPSALPEVERELSLLLRRARALSAELSREIHPDIDAGGYALLSTLTEAGPLRANDLAELFGVDKSSISRQVQRLERLGLLERRHDDSDRRALLLGATPEGRRRLAAAADARRLRFRARLGAWNEADVTHLAALLRRLNAALG
ncbi:MAG: MarR family transcriptional regulator [Pseudonocardiales bacterium]|nr:MAG: MarR family transcriptional regulator [Pseudonocardiales bacterium]